MDVAARFLYHLFLRDLSFAHLVKVMAAPVSVALEVGAAVVASPAGVLELDTHSSSEADQSESSPPPVSIAPMVLPFLCSDDSESDTEIPKRHVSPTTSIPEIPTAPILPAPSATVAPSSEALIVRKSVGPLPSQRLALRYTSHHLDHFNSGSSSSHSSSDHSSSRHSISGHSLPGHTPPNTTDADSSTPLRFVYPPLARTLWCSEAYLRWRSTPLSTMYPMTTSESLAGDSSSESFAGPSHKRCRSPAATVTSSIYSMRALVPSRTDLLPPLEQVEEGLQDIYDHVIEIPLQRIEDIEMRQIELKSRSLIASRDGNGGARNGGNGNGGNGNPNENNKDARPVARECTYQDFMKCQPLNFKGTEGVVELIRWFEKMETVFHISNCLEKYQVKCATCTLLNSALTWWNSHKRTIGGEAAFAMSWREPMKLMAKVYCPRNEIQKMESELWNLTVKNNDLATYT
ncbi:reverse transcriptase domain-containing protein [Tanacetum coccineum]